MFSTSNSIAVLWFRIICVSMAPLPRAALPCSISSRVSACYRYYLPGGSMPMISRSTNGSGSLDCMCRQAHRCLWSCPCCATDGAVIRTGNRFRWDDMPARNHADSPRLAGWEGLVDIGKDIQAVGREWDERGETVHLGYPGLGMALESA